MWTAEERRAHLCKASRSRWGNRSPADRFWAKVDRSGGDDACWPWTGARLPHGYGAVRIAGVTRLTHRLVWEFAHGTPPAGVIRHECDHTWCCNPAHLAEGSQAENLKDCHEKDRHARGERNGHAKLTDETVREIRTRRAAGETCVAIARDVGVRPGHVSRICSGLRWKHLENAPCHC
jgi:hypothetical protein